MEKHYRFKQKIGKSQYRKIEKEITLNHNASLIRKVKKVSLRLATKPLVAKRSRR